MKNISRNDFGPGSTVVALLYKSGEAPAVILEKDKDLPEEFASIDSQDIKKVSEFKGLIVKGSQGEEVKSWQKILVAALGKDMSEDSDFKKVKVAAEGGAGAGKFGPSTEALTKAFQIKCEKYLNVNPDGDLVDKNKVAVGPEMKAVLKFVVNQRSEGERQELSEEVKPKEDSKKEKEQPKDNKKEEQKEKAPTPKKPLEKPEESTEEVSALEELVTPNSNIPAEVKALLGVSWKEMDSGKTMSLEERQGIVKLLPEAIRKAILGAEPSKHGKDYFGGTKGQNKALYNYLTYVKLPEVVTVKGVQVERQAAAQIPDLDKAIVARLRKTERYDQVREEMGIDQNTTIDESIASADALTTAVEKAGRSIRFEQELKALVQKKVDGGFFEGGILGIFQSAYKALNKDAGFQGDLNNLAKKYGQDPSEFSKKYDALYSGYIERAKQMDASFTQNPVRYIADALNLKESEVQDRMERNGDFLEQTKRFLARDLVAGIFGIIPITHVRLDFAQKGVHEIYKFGEASEALIRENALQEMEAAATAAGLSQLKLRNYLKGNNYSSLRNPANASVRERQPSSLSSKERQQVESLRRAAAAIGIEINGTPDKPGHMSIVITDASILKKDSYTFWESFPILGGDARDKSKVNAHIRTLKSGASTTAKLQAIQSLGVLFQKEFNEDFGGKRSREAVNRTIPSEAALKAVPLSKRMSFINSKNFLGSKYNGLYFQAKNGERIPEWSKIPGAEINLGGGKFKYEQNMIVLQHFKANPSLFDDFCSHVGLKSGVQEQLSSKEQNRLGLMRQFSRSSGYVSILLDAQNFHEQGANAIERGNQWQREFMALMGQFRTFEDLQKYDLVVGSDVEVQLRNYFGRSRYVEGRSLKLAQEMSKDRAVVKWAEMVADYLNGKKDSYTKYYQDNANKEAQDLLGENGKARIEAVKKGTYAGDLDKILGTSPTGNQLAAYVLGTEVNGNNLAALYSTKIAELTGAHLSTSLIVESIARSAQKGSVRGRNTSPLTNDISGQNYSGPGYTFTVPGQSPIRVINENGQGVRMTTEYTFAIKPGCSNLVFLDATGRQIKVVESFADDNYIATHERFLIGVGVNKGSSKKGAETTKEDTPINFGGEGVKEGSSANFGSSTPGVVDASVGGLTENTGTIVTEALESGANTVIIPGGFKP